MCGSLLSSLSFLVWCSYSTAMIESHLLYYYYVVADDDTTAAYDTIYLLWGL